MIASIHVADMSLFQVPDFARRCRSFARDVDGLLHSDFAVAAPLGPSVLPAPTLGRIVMVATWTGDDAFDRFVASAPLAARFATGWRVRLEAIRASGEWPGLPEELPRSREIAGDGPTVVLTLGRLRMRRATAFFRASARAEAQILRSPGLLWATGMGMPPFVGTCSLWKDAESLSRFAYGDGSSGHGQAMSEDHRDKFHRVSAFVRCRPYDSVGQLSGKNPLAADWMVAAHTGPMNSPYGDRSRPPTVATPPSTQNMMQR